MDQDLLFLTRLLVRRSLVSIEDILIETDASQRQIFYRLDKLNSLLDKNKVKSIKIENRIFVLENETRDFLLNYLYSPHLTENYYMNRVERMRYLYLMMFIDSDYLALQDILFKLEVSKSTVMQDLKELEAILAQDYITIDYNREKGYFLTGNEYKIRQKMLEIVVDALAEEGGGKVLDIFLSDYKFNTFKDTKKVLDKIATEQDIHFVGNRLSEFIYIFLLSAKRVEKNNGLNINELAHTTLIPTFKEYLFTEEILKYFSYNYFTQEEIIYISSWVLGSIVGNVEESTGDILIIGELSGKILSRFESISGIEFDDKETIYRHIYSHMRPAYYRLIFRHPISNPLCDRVQIEYPDLFYLVKITMNEFENIFEAKIPDDEIAYLTLHFSSIYHSKSSKVNRKKRAFIICSHGIGSSVVLYNELSSMFPQFEFEYPLSERSFNPQKHFADIIFTTEYFPNVDNNRQPVIKVNPILDAYEKTKVREDVYYQLKLGYWRKEGSAVVADILAKHLDGKVITDALIQDITTLVYRQPKQLQEEKSKDHYKLKDILDSRYIYCQSEAKNWEEIIFEASKDLIRDNKISAAYAQVISTTHISQIKNYHISPYIALPHTSPEYGAHACAMSILILKEEIFITDQPLRFVFFLSAEDNKKHIPAMKDFLELIQDETLLSQLTQISDPHEVYDLIFEKFNT